MLAVRCLQLRREEVLCDMWASEAIAAVPPVRCLQLRREEVLCDMWPDVEVLEGPLLIRGPAGLWLGKKPGPKEGPTSVGALPAVPEPQVP